MLCVLYWPWKLHRIAQEEGEISWELYNLENDSMETTNIAVENEALKASMQASLEKWQISVVNSMNGADY